MANRFWNAGAHAMAEYNRPRDSLRQPVLTNRSQSKMNRSITACVRSQLASGQTLDRTAFIMMPER